MLVFFSFVFSQDSHDINPSDPIDPSMNSDMKSTPTLPTTTTYSIPSKIGKISTQTLLSPSGHNNSATNSFSWFSRLSHRFNSSTPTTTSTRATNQTSSTGLIFENRPTNLPPKSNEETLKHHVEYQKMCLEAKRAQQIFDEKEEQRQRLKLKREEFVSKSLTNLDT